MNIYYLYYVYWINQAREDRVSKVVWARDNLERIQSPTKEVSVVFYKKRLSWWGFLCRLLAHHILEEMTSKLETPKSVNYH